MDHGGKELGGSQTLIRWVATTVPNRRTSSHHERRDGPPSERAPTTTGAVTENRTQTSRMAPWCSALELQPRGASGRIRTDTTGLGRPASCRWTTLACRSRRPESNWHRRHTKTELCPLSYIGIAPLVAERAPATEPRKAQRRARGGATGIRTRISGLRHQGLPIGRSPHLAGRQGFEP